MRRKDREVVDSIEILDILQKCDTVSIGMNGKDYPYVVPVSFGAAQTEEGVVIYFHGINQGKKVEMLDNDAHVCVEGHIFYKTEELQQGITTRYESVIAFGIAQKAEGEEIIQGLKAITAHYHYSDYPVDGCTSLPMTAVYKVVLKQLTGKRNPGNL